MSNSHLICRYFFKGVEMILIAKYSEYCVKIPFFFVNINFLVNLIEQYILIQMLLGFLNLDKRAPSCSPTENGHGTNVHIKLYCLASVGSSQI